MSELSYASAIILRMFFTLILTPFLLCFQLAHQDFSSQLKEMSPVCSVPSTVVQPVKAPLTAFAVTDTIALTQIPSRCHAQVSIVLTLLHMNFNNVKVQRHECVFAESLISYMNSLTHAHFTPASRRAPGSKDSGILCNSEQRNPVRAVPHTNAMLTCPQCDCPQI